MVTRAIQKRKTLGTLRLGNQRYRKNTSTFMAGNNRVHFLRLGNKKRHQTCMHLHAYLHACSHAYLHAYMLKRPDLKSASTPNGLQLRPLLDRHLLC